MSTHHADEFSVVRQSFKPELKAITEELTLFGQAHGREPSPKSFEALQRYVSRNWYEQMGKAGVQGASYEIQVIAPLAAFRSEFEYLIRDSEVEGRSLTELAFEHLRRLIVVDEQVRKNGKAPITNMKPFASAWAPFIY